MITVTRFAPLLRGLVTALALGLCLHASAQSNFSKKVLHTDNTTTESWSDVDRGELRESTFDSRGVLMSKRVVLLNEQGQPVQGIIYNGRDQMVGSVQFAYDDLGRMKEEISLNAQGQIFRRKIQGYDQTGQPLASTVFDYSGNAPPMSTASVNFTKRPGAGQGAAPAAAQPEQPKLPGQAPQIEKVSPNSKPEEKKGFFKRMFNK